jgi:hypothetical protein
VVQIPYIGYESLKSKENGIICIRLEINQLRGVLGQAG